MKAAFVQPDGSVKVSDCPTPEPGPGDLLVKVAYCGICGSDIHALSSGLIPYGCIMGHELSGQIAVVGAAVTGWREGDPVVVLPLDPCFSCGPCRRGDVQLCAEGMSRAYGLGVNPGGFGQYMLVKPTMVFRTPQGLDLKAAALNEPWAVAVHGVNMSGVKIGDSALVMGAGPIGLLCVSALRLAGAGLICVSEPDPFRLNKARALGVDIVLDPSSDSPGGAVQERTGRPPAFVFDCAGTATSLEEAAGIADRQGHIVALGVHMGNASIFPLSWFLKETRLSFSFGYTYREFASSLQLLASGAVNPDTVISDVIPLSDINHAMQMLHGSGHTKILVDCQAV